MTPKICSYVESGLRRFTLPESRNLNQENVRAWLAWWHQQYARMETTPRELEQRQGGQRRFEVSIKGLSTPTLLDSEIPANAT